jgi:hypothetical protein
MLSIVVSEPHEIRAKLVQLSWNTPRLCDPKNLQLLTRSGVSLTKVSAIMHDLSQRLKQHLVIDSNVQRTIERRVSEPGLRFSSKVKSLHAAS